MGARHRIPTSAERMKSPYEGAKKSNWPPVPVSNLSPEVISFISSAITDPYCCKFDSIAKFDGSKISN
jgi:hypothetical protein